MKQLFKERYDSIFIVMLTLVIFLVVFLPFIVHNSLDRYDAPGLLSLSWFIKEYTFPDFQGWNPFFYAGFPQGLLYPPLFHYLVGGLAYLTSVTVAYKAVITFFGLLIPASLYTFSKTFFESKKKALLCVVTSLIALIILPGFLGFNFDGLIDYGLTPSFISIPLFFWYLAEVFKDNSRRSLRKTAIIFSLLILTHLFTAVVAGAITLVFTFMNLFKRLGEYTFSMIMSFLLTAFWSVPFLYYSGYSASGFAMRASIMYPIAILVLALVSIASLLLLFKKTSMCKPCLAMAIITFGIGVLGLTDNLLNRSTTQFSFPLIHPFRLLGYGLMLGIFVISFTVSNSLEKLYALFDKRVHLRINSLNVDLFIKSILLLGSFFVIAGLGLFRLQTVGVEKIVLTKDTDWNARVMRVYKISEVLDQSRAVIDRSVIQKKNKFAVMGLLKESSFLAPYYQSLAKNINPDNYDWTALDQYYIENKQIPQEKVPFLMNLLWVNGLFTIDTNIPDCTDYKHISTFTTNTADDGRVTRDMYICSYQPTQNSNFAEVIYEKPDVVQEDWNKAVEQWWTSDSSKLFTSEEIPFSQTTTDYTIIPQVTFNNNYQSLHISTGVDEEVPVLIKMSYLPKWRAYDDEGNRVQIYRTSPNLMIVPVKGHVSLYYQMTQLEWMTLLISIVGWITIFFIPQYGRMKAKLISLVSSSKK